MPPRQRTMNHPHLPKACKRAITLHGFNVSDGGRGTTDKLHSGLEDMGLEVVDFDTEWEFGIIRDLISARMGNVKRARRLARMLQPGDMLIGHSNGGCIIDIATWMVPCIPVGAIYINPALDRDAPISPGILELHVLHTPTDNVVGVARRLIGSRWGSMGRDGYMGDPDPRAINVSHELFGLSDTGHSGIFDTDEGIEAILSRADLLAHRINHS